MTNMIKIGLLFRVNHLICIYNLQVLSNNNCLASSYTFKDRYSEFHHIGVGTGGAGGALAPPVKNVGGREYPSAPPVFMAENPLFWCLSEYLEFCLYIQNIKHNDILCRNIKQKLIFRQKHEHFRLASLAF